MRLAAANRPTACAFYGAFDHFTLGWLRTLVETHDDVRAQILLNFHRSFRCQAMLTTFQMAAKGYPFVINLIDLCQAEYLEATGISQHRPRPLHKLVNTTHIAH